MRDLSHELYSGMPVYPGDPEVTIEPALSLADDGVVVQRVHIGSHSGTHLDAPAHTVIGGRTLDQVSLEELIGQALIFRPQVESPREITPEDLGLDGLDCVPRIIIIATGWHQYFGTEKYMTHPYLSEIAAQRLWELGMRVLAVDALSPDSTPSERFPVHEIVLGQDGLIIENLTGLDDLPDRIDVGFFPVKLGEVDGAPVRAVVLNQRTS